MTNGAYVRRDIWAVERDADDSPWDPYTLAYARAVGVMRRRAPDDPTSWSYQAAMHGTYRQPADPLWNGCQHGSWFFLPWHRIYIWYFEQIVRSVVIENAGPDDWALPYWNYTDGPPGSAALPPGFRAQALFRGDRSTSRIRTACSSLSPTTTSTSWSAATSRRWAVTRDG
jgi:Common central domain of tyrosinase